MSNLFQLVAFWGSVNISGLLQLFSSSLVCHVRLVSFYVYFTLYVFVHPSCSVVVSCIMFIPVYIICYFQLPCFNLCLDEINFCGSEDLKSVKSVCDNNYYSLTVS